MISLWMQEFLAVSMPAFFVISVNNINNISVMYIVKCGCISISFIKALNLIGVFVHTSSGTDPDMCTLC